MSTGWASVAVLALVGVSAGAAEPDGVYFEDRGAPVDVEGVLAPRRFAPEPPSPTGPLAARLVWVDPTRTATAVGGIARDEVRGLLRKMNVTSTWRIGEPREVGRAGEVSVILLDRPAVAASGEPILGATPPHFEGTPFVWIHVPNVRGAVGLRDDRPPADIHAVRALGLALGRVIAHELVHVMAPSEPHGRGLMSEMLTRLQLTAAGLDVEPGVGMAVRAGLRGEGALPPAGTGVLAATHGDATNERKRRP